MTNQELTLLVAKAKAGDKRALNDLLAAFYDDLSHFALRTVKDPELAADITQDSCIEIISSIGDLENPDRFGSWARTIVYHKCMRYFNSKKEIIADENEDGDTIFDQLPDEEGSLPERVLEDKEFQRIMQQLLDELPGEQRAALMLYYYEKMSVKQIASIQGVGEGTVKSRLNYGIKAVKVRVEAYEKKSGTKLHAALPLVLLGLFDYGKKSTPVANLPLSVTAAIESFGKTSAVSSSAVLKAGAPSKSGVAVAGHVATKGAALAVKKIVIGVIAALVAAGGALGGVLLATNGLSSGPAVSKEQECPSSAVADETPFESDGGGEVPPSEHAHSGRAWEFVDDTHYSICTICGQQVGKAEAHIFDDEGNCTVCDCGYFSKGLVYEHLGKYSLQVAGIGSCTDETIVIPAIYKGCSVVSIDMGAFQDNKQIKKVVIPDEFDTVGQHAFSGCTSLTEVQFLGSCRLLQSYSFENCTALKKVTLPVIPRILGGIFNNSSSLEELIIPEGVQTIGQGAFYDCTALKKVSFPSTLRHIEDMAFDGCSSLEALSLPEGTEHIGEQAFFGCSALTELSVPGSVRTVARSAFSFCTNLREVVLLDGVSEVVSAFENCDALERVTLPTSLSSVVGVFWGSDKLKTVIYSGTAAEWHAVDKGPWSVSAEGFTVRCSDRTYTGDSPFVHDFPESFTVTAVGHSKRCACGEQSSVEAHNFENGYCIDCGWGASCGHLEFMEMSDGYYVSWFG
ncbi:MAG: sigma-70 family RNA polymerase sigma factor, partial [Clostridia bacterium]|nr:sigma-70 family RNA polymerase sigma factor [Clostridia bacterium]